MHFVGEGKPREVGELGLLYYKPGDGLIQVLGKKYYTSPESTQAQHFGKLMDLCMKFDVYNIPI